MEGVAMQCRRGQGFLDGGCGHAVREGWSGMEGVGGTCDGGCGRGQGWRVWEGPGMEGVGGHSFSL